MTFDRVRQSLTGVKSTGQGRLIARCPAHEDRAPSLAVRELDDGRVLMHCFAGCDVHEVVGALGLELSDLFPPKPATAGGGHKPERRPFLPSDVFELARREVGIAAVIAIDMHSGRTVSDIDHARLMQAAQTLDRIAEAAYARP